MTSDQDLAPPLILYRLDQLRAGQEQIRGELADLRRLENTLTALEAGRVVEFGSAERAEGIAEDAQQ